jgi:hypothetical protein
MPYLLGSTKILTIYQKIHGSMSEADLCQRNHPDFGISNARGYLSARCEGQRSTLNPFKPSRKTPLISLSSARSYDTLELPVLVLGPTSKPSNLMPNRHLATNPFENVMEMKLMASNSSSEFVRLKVRRS